MTIYMNKEEALKKASEITIKRADLPVSTRDVHLNGFVLDNKIRMAKEIFLDALEVGAIEITEAPLDEFVFNPEEVNEAIAKGRVVNCD